MISDAEQSKGKKPGKKPGNKGVKAPAHIVQERIELVADLLARGANSRQIRLTLKAAPHNITTTRHVENYVSRARDWLLKTAAGMDKRQALAESIAFYRSVIADKKTETRDKLTARTRLDFIFGLDAPKPKWQPEIAQPLPPAEEIARSDFDSTFLNSLETVYGEGTRQRVIEINSKQLPAPVAAPIESKRPKLKLA